MIRYQIGIDIGFYGGVSVLDSYQNTLRCYPTPLIETSVSLGKKKKIVRSYDLDALRDIFRIYDPKQSRVLIELVHAMPQQGVVSTFKFGESLGLTKGVLAGLGFENVQMITPQEWKKTFRLIKTTKKDSIKKASELFPKCGDNWRLMKHDGIAESALIMAHCNLEYVEKHGADTVSV